MWTLSKVVAMCVAGVGFFAGVALGEGERVTVDLSQAVRIHLPAASNKAVSFTTSDGKKGWVRQISSEALPTPAYAKGRIFTGGGFNSRDFVAVDAETGATVWSKQTMDNGPTSPVVANGMVSFNTESCHTETRDEDSGDLVWGEVTGSTLMTQPVVCGKLLVIPHPFSDAHRDSRFRMLVAELSTGKHYRDLDITGDVLGAPVVAGDSVYCTCTDGRVFCMPTLGHGGWHVVANATSAPVVVGDVLAVTTSEAGTFSSTVAIRRYAIDDGRSLDAEPLVPTKISAGGTAPERAGWDYQGPKLAGAGKQLFEAVGNQVNSVTVDGGKLVWHAAVEGKGISNMDGTLLPPALGKAAVYVATKQGSLVGLRQTDGGMTFAYSLETPLCSPPVLAKGKLYIGTANGLLICLNLEDADADGWTAWGGDSQHNHVQ